MPKRRRPVVAPVEYEGDAARLAWDARYRGLRPTGIEQRVEDLGRVEANRRAGPFAPSPGTKKGAGKPRPPR